MDSIWFCSFLLYDLPLVASSDSAGYCLSTELVIDLRLVVNHFSPGVAATNSLERYVFPLHHFPTPRPHGASCQIMNPSTSTPSNCDSNRSASFTTDPNDTAQDRNSVGTRAFNFNHPLSELPSQGSQMDVKPPCEASHSLDKDPALLETFSDEAERPNLEERSSRTSIQDSNRDTMGDQAGKLLSTPQSPQPELSL